MQAQEQTVGQPQFRLAPLLPLRSVPHQECWEGSAVAATQMTVTVTLSTLLSSFLSFQVSSLLCRGGAENSLLLCA
ncbi:hypothetical protein DEO72_LG11g986 [Vigna unguiculata]|uniref:Uncharacterized protein n=1 Tax=Vigna unguiculata TaxID=3917 RepID=A0A4D6NKV0_VIGUN|nr:hypothetical protein DEO72_LG11g986 [Vigna unguiculata]